MKNIITVGEAMGLFVADEVGSLEKVNKFTKYTAGAEMNVAIGISRLGFNSYYVTQFGNDPLGRYIKNVLENENVKTDYVFFSEEDMTGFQLKEKVLKGDPQVFNYRKGSAASKFNKSFINSINFKKFDHVHLSGVFLSLTENTKEISYCFAELAKKNKILTTFDPNLRPKLWKSKEEMVTTINDLATKCDMVLPGVSEGEILTGYSTPEYIADFYLSKGLKCVIIKLGEAGAYYQEENSKGVYVKGYKVDKIIDTVGAGDGFAVGIISGLAEGLTLEEAVKRGNAIGALQLMSSSDNEGLPNNKELQNFMEGR